MKFMKFLTKFVSDSSLSSLSLCVEPLQPYLAYPLTISLFLQTSIPILVLSLQQPEHRHLLPSSSLPSQISRVMSVFSLFLLRLADCPRHPPELNCVSSFWVLSNNSKEEERGEPRFKLPTQPDPDSWI